MQQFLVAAVAAVLLSSCTSETASRAGASINAGHTAASAPTCPAADFPGFLLAFSSHERVRSAHTAPFVQVTDWIDVDETGQGTSVERVPRGAYKDFKLRRSAGRYVHVEHDDAPDPVPVEPRITAIAGGYRVEYIFNMSEGNSWIFAQRQDCWQLVADPDPSLL